MSYKIVRNYLSSNYSVAHRTIKSGLTEAQAKAHCQDPKTSSDTNPNKKVSHPYFKEVIRWFDSYTKE